MRKLLCGFVVVTAFLTVSRVKADSITLNSGEMIVGEIRSETEKDVQILVSNASRTITSLKIIPKTDIKTVQRETPEQKQEREAYEALAKWQLNPNQEFTETQYTGGIALFEKFLSTYPQSNLAEEMRTRQAAWKADLGQLQSGKVKFSSKWMSPEEKKLAYEQWQKDHRVQETKYALDTLKRDLANLELQKKQLADGLAIDQGRLQSSQQALQNLRDTTATTLPRSTGSSGSGYWAHNRNGIPYWVPTGQDTVPGQQVTVTNPDRAKLQDSVAWHQGQITKGQTTLTSLNTQIVEVQSKIGRADAEYKLALAKSQEKPPPPPIAVVQAPPPTPPPAPVPEPSWYVKYWKWLAGGFFLAVLYYLVTRVDAWRSG